MSDKQARPIVTIVKTERATRARRQVSQLDFDCPQEYNVEMGEKELADMPGVFHGVLTHV